MTEGTDYETLFAQTATYSLLRQAKNHFVIKGKHHYKKSSNQNTLKRLKPERE